MRNLSSFPPHKEPGKGGGSRRLGMGCLVTTVILVVGLVIGITALAPRWQSLVTLQPTPPPLGIEDRTSPAAQAARTAQEVAQLTSYGWINQESGLAHIPIDRAMALLAASGLPVKVESTPTPDPALAATDPVTATVDLSNVGFQADVLPIFVKHCSECHGDKDPEEQLELITYRTAMAGSQNGKVIEPGDPDNSYLVKMIVTGKMPKKGDPLTQTEIDTIIAWIKAGALDN